MYEHPRSAFVAGFVGVSNFVDDDVARAITGRAEMNVPETFTIRPEKIHIAEAGAQISSDMYGADGRIREVVYLGIYTRYHVTLDLGGELTVVEQNLNTTSMDALAARGKPVRLLWKREHIQPIKLHR